MKFMTTLFLRVEERARRAFERTPFLQAFFAGIGVIIFWRGIWEWFDYMQVSPLLSVVIGSIILVGIGVFVQTFIGNTIIIKNVKHEEQTERKAVREIEGEVVTEEVTLADLAKRVDRLAEKIEHIK